MTDRSKGWLWLYSRIGLWRTLRYWWWGQKHGWLKAEEFPAWLRARGFPVPKDWSE